MFSSGGRKVSLAAYQKIAAELLEQCITNSEPHEWICFTCHSHLLKNSMPPQAEANDLHVCDIPVELQRLTDLESRLLSQRYPFMKILLLPRGKQKAVHGSMVNVPVDVQETCSILPRCPTSNGLIALKIKRKLSYRGHVFSQYIRPSAINEALLVLKRINPLYADCTFNTNWQDEYVEADSELWEGLTSDNPAHNTEQSTKVQEDTLPEAQIQQKVSSHDIASVTATLPKDEEQEENTEEEYQSDEETEDNPLRSVSYDTCMCPDDILTDQFETLSLAPGEGQKPRNPLQDLNAEVLAFPQLFPDGKFGFDATRKKTLTLKKYFNARLLHFSGKFARNIEYLFYSVALSEKKQLQDSVNIALRKSKAWGLTAASVKDTTARTAIIHTDRAFTFMRDLRGSPAFCQKMLYELLAMVKQLGVCTWFLTLSAADLSWSEIIQILARQYGTNYSQQQVKDMDWETKTKWIRTNPVTVARLFDYRVQLFFKMLKSSPILGVIEHYYYRVEFQQRGSPHIHCVLWAKDAPKLPEATDNDITQFVDKYISCKISNDDDELSQLVVSLQKHTHNKTCRKSGKQCRFNFPRPPSKTTLICRVESSTEIPDKQKNKDILSSVKKVLSDDKTPPDADLDFILNTANVTYEQYETALKQAKTCNAIFMQRTPQECCINNYNPNILKAWKANMDLQYVCDAYACIMYICSYVTKAERNMSDMLQAVAKQAGEQDVQQKLQTVSKTFLNHREMSAQEAVYHALSLPLKMSSTQILFVPSDPPQDRLLLLKPLSQIDAMDDDDEDIYMGNLIEKYAARPVELANMCYAEFAATYTYDTSKSTSMDHQFNIHLEDISDDKPKKIKLLNELGYMRARSKIAIIRTHRHSQTKNPEKYFYSKLLLYYPWMNENRDLADCQSFEQKYLLVKNIIDENIQKFEPLATTISQVFDNMEENPLTEEAWDEINPQAQQSELTDMETGVEEDPSHLLLDPSGTDIPTDSLFTSGSTAVTQPIHSISGPELRENIRTLNYNQRQVFSHILSWATQLILSRKSEQKVDPIYLFVSGGAGTGKSHLIKTIYHTVKNILKCEGDDPDDITVLLTAPTGCAACNIHGLTIHSALNFSFSISSSEYVRLGAEKLNTLRNKYSNLAVLIIDEISMVGANALLNTSKRLNDIKGTPDGIFGNISVLCFGDLGQLPPIGQPSVYDLPSKSCARVYGSLWQKHFQFFELTEIMRQKDDVEFANLLNRIRVSKITPPDTAILQSRLGKDCPPETLHVFATRAKVAERNEDMLKTLTTPIISIIAIDTKTDNKTNKLKITLSDDSKLTADLVTKLRLGVDARVMLIKNVNVQDSLVNGSQGSVFGFLPPPPTPLTPEYKPSYIMVKFDNPATGYMFQQQHRHLQTQYPGCVAIGRFEALFNVGKYGAVQASRRQFPLTLSWACTIHKVQGATLNKVAVSFEKKFNPGQAYVALSRAQKLDDLYLLDLNINKITFSLPFLKEMERLRTLLIHPVTHSPVMDNELSFVLLNIQSLPEHHQDIIADPNFQTVDVMMLTETWLSSRHSNPQIDNYVTTRRDRCDSYIMSDLYTASFMKRGGVAFYTKDKFTVHSPHSDELLRGIEYQPITLFYNRIPIVCFIVIYKPPSSSVMDFFRNLESILQQCPHLNVHTIVAGDFNINTLEDSNHSRTLQALMKHHGFIQLGNSPTHRYLDFMPCIITIF